MPQKTTKQKWVFRQTKTSEVPFSLILEGPPAQSLLLPLAANEAAVSQETIPGSASPF